MDNKNMLHPVIDDTCKETLYEDFISREEFINRTGIFVTHEYFKYIYNMKFKKSNIPMNEFVKDYEEKYSDCIMEIPLNGTFKYEIMDDNLSCIGIYEDHYEPNIWEIINSLAALYTKERQLKREVIEKYKIALDNSLKTLMEIQLEYEKPSKIQS